MMLLISLAILVGFGASAASALGLFGLEFWWELSLLICPPSSSPSTPSSCAASTSGPARPDPRYHPCP
jgi:hypothetical protein